MIKLIFASRTKNYALHFKTTRTKNGASWPTKWELVSLLQLAARGPRSSLGILARWEKWARWVRTYSNQRLLQEYQLLERAPTSTRSSPTLAIPQTASTNNSPEVHRDPSINNNREKHLDLSIGRSLLDLQALSIRHSFSNNDAKSVMSRA